MLIVLHTITVTFSSSTGGQHKSYGYYCYDTKKQPFHVINFTGSIRQKQEFRGNGINSRFA